MILAAHLWQSTICVLAAWAVTMALRHQPARIRHGIWLFASIKFLLPFSALVAAGNYAARWVPLDLLRTSAAAEWLDRSLPAWSVTILAGPAATFSQSLERTLIVALTLTWLAGALAIALTHYRGWRAVCAIAAAARPLDRGPEREALQRLTLGAPAVRMLTSDSHLEPGVLGILRPTILWPIGLSDRLERDELETVIAHEICHVRHRDNASALLQAIVETLFWFHPLVWWIGANLVRERERGCDEEVLTMLEPTNARSYATAILKVGQFCLRSPAAVMAGVGGSHLASRIERIMAGSVRRSSVSTRLALVAIATVAVALPVTSGALSARGAGVVAQDAERQVYKPGKDVTTPRIVKEVKPAYTKEAMQAKIQGRIMLQGIVREDGSVTDIVVTESLDREHGLDDEAVKSLAQWQFEPGTKDGKPVPVRVDIEMTFRLK
jgi:bla regulator protein blaR1